LFPRIFRVDCFYRRRALTEFPMLHSSFFGDGAQPPSARPLSRWASAVIVLLRNMSAFGLLGWTAIFSFLASRRTFCLPTKLFRWRKLHQIFSQPNQLAQSKGTLHTIFTTPKIPEGIINAYGKYNFLRSRIFSLFLLIFFTSRG
jgi:hypothetical protein